MLQHALLYSIKVNLSAQRIGQLDRVLVLASPITDINLHAWDLNRVQRFFQLDIGIRMELCARCLQNKSERSITFIMERMFIKDCLKFLSEESRIESPPIEENGLLVYTVPHQCFNARPTSVILEASTSSSRDNFSLPPPYSENTPPPLMPKGIQHGDKVGDVTDNDEHDYEIAEFVETADIGDYCFAGQDTSISPLTFAKHHPPPSPREDNRLGSISLRPPAEIPKELEILNLPINDSPYTASSSHTLPTIPPQPTSEEHPLPISQHKTEEQPLPSLPNHSQLLERSPSYEECASPSLLVRRRFSEPLDSSKPSPPISSPIFPGTQTMTPAFQFDEEVWGDYSGSGSTPLQSMRSASFSESLLLTKTTTKSETQTFPELPPRTIPRPTLPSEPEPPLYVNFGPILFQKMASSAEHFGLKTPYQVSQGSAVKGNEGLHYEQKDATASSIERSDEYHIVEAPIRLPPRGIVKEQGDHEFQGDNSTSARENTWLPQPSVMTHPPLTYSPPQSIAGIPQVTPPHPLPSHSDNFNPVSATSHSSSISYPPPSRPDIAVDHSLPPRSSPHQDNKTVDSLTFYRPPSRPDTHTAAKHSLTPLSSSFLSRTGSDSHVNLIRSKRLSTDSAPQTNRLSQASLDGYEEDIYVIVTPHSKYSTTDSNQHRPASPAYSSLLSPPYIRDMNLPRKVVVSQEEEEGGEVSPLFYEVFSSDSEDEDSESASVLSLADAGDVIRREWMDSFEVLRQEERSRSASETQASKEIVADKIQLMEVAYFDYKSKLRSSSSCDYVDNSFFQPPQPNQSRSGWITETSGSSDGEVATVVPAVREFEDVDSKLGTSHALKVRPHSSSAVDVMFSWPSDTHFQDTFFQSQDTQFESYDAHFQSPKTYHQSRDSLGGEMNLRSEDYGPEIRPRSQLVARTKPAITPRKKPSNSSTSSVAATSRNQAAISSEMEQSKCSNSVPVPNKLLKPTPMPRSPQSRGMKISNSASMVTMGIGYYGRVGLSSSESNLLDAIHREGEEQGEWLGFEASLGSNLNKKFHSSLDISNF